MKDELSEFKLSEKIKEKLKNNQLLREELASGKTPQDILEFHETTMLKFYRAAYHLYEEKMYSDAANAFLFLVTLNIHQYDYWIGLGISTQMCGHYEEAIDAYEMAAVIDIESPIPYFYLAKCLFAIHDRQSALQAIDLSIEYAEGKDQYLELIKQAKSARSLLLT